MPPVGLAVGADYLLNGGKATKGIAGGIGTPGKNNFEAHDYSQSSDYNPNDFEYGGHAGGAQAQADQYGGTANNYTQGAYQNFTNSAGNFGAAGEDRQQAYAARGQQQDALGLMAQRAHGQDLISNKVAQQQANALAAQQSSLGASARGPAALALAQQGAAANTSAGQAQIAGQAGINAAQEQLANEQAYFGGASGIRGQDIGQMGATTNLGAAQGNMAAQQGQLGLGYSGLQNKVQEDQLNAQMQKQGMLSGSHNQGQQLMAGVSTANAANEWKPYEMALGVGQGVGQIGVAASDPDAKEGTRVLGDQDGEPDVVSGKPSQFDQPKKTKTKAEKMAVMQSPSWLPKNFSTPNAHMLKPLQLPEVSDPRAKGVIGALGLGTPDVANDALHSELSSPGGDMKLKGGGLDVMGSLGAINAHVNSAVKNPGWGAIASDPAAKDQILALYEPEGMQLHMSPEGHAGLVSEEKTKPSGASLSGAAPKYSHAAPVEAKAKAAPAPRAERKMTPEEMSAEADRMLGQIQAQRDAQMARGPAVQPALDRSAPPPWLSQYMATQQASDPKAKEDVRDEGEIDDPKKMGPIDSVAQRIVKASGVDTSPEARARRGEKLSGAIASVEHKAEELRPTLAKFTHPLQSVLEATHLRPHEETPQERQIRENQYKIDALQRAKTQTDIDADRKRLAAATPQTSDPRGKVLGGVHENEVADMLDHTPAVEYRYKSEYFEPDAQRPGEEQAGFLTSDLKKTPLGAAVVEQRPDGYEGYNQHRMIGLEFAGLRNVHERLRDLEAIIAEKHRGGKKGG